MDTNLLYIVLGLAGFAAGLVCGCGFWAIYSTISELIRLWPRN